MFRRSFPLFVALVLVMSGGSVAAQSAGIPGHQPQTIRSTSGSVAVPSSGVGRVQRCADTAAGSQGIAGVTIDITPGAAFELKATDALAGVQDFDIDFYQAYTPCAEGAVVPVLQHENVDGDEAGIVPQDATKAVVRLHRGAAGSFTYTEQPLARMSPNGRGPAKLAVIDTGLRATHQEFDYCGCGQLSVSGLDPDAQDQLVGWWDFSREKPDGTRLAATEINLPGAGEVWDTRVAHPYDRHGHGTAVSSIAVGQNRNLDKDLAFAPGFKLAVAKVGEGNGTISGDLAAAVRWAVDNVEADVVSMSIGSAVPIPAALASSFYKAAEYARSKGVLVVVSNGNGFNNMSLVPGEPGWATAYGNSTKVLSVGAGGHLPYSGTVQSGYQATTDGEVSAKYNGVGVAGVACDTCYTAMGGTSFSAPIVAGMALRIIGEMKPRKHATPDYVETLLKYSARDTQAPPSFDGYGRLDYHQFFNVALPHAKQRTLPARPSPDVSGTYVETVGGTLRSAWTDTLRFDLPERISLIYLARTGLPALTAPGTIGPSAPTGAGEAEVYTFQATAGETVDLGVTYTAPEGWEGAQDLDAFVFTGTDPLLPVPAYSAVTQVGRSTNGAGTAESISFTAPSTGTYHFVILGWSIVADQPFSLQSSAPLTFAGDGQYAHNFGI